MTTDRSALEAARDALIQQITDYLSGGGLFNPEMANHEAVRDLLIECRAALSSPPVLPAEPTLETYGDKLAADLRAMWKRASPEDRPMLSAAAWCVRAYMKLRDAPVEVKRPTPVTLTARQLRNALYFIAPDFDTDEDQRDHEGCIAWVEEGSTVDDDGKPDPAGYVVWSAEYPEEGSIPLADEWAAPAPQEAAPALDDARDADTRRLDWLETQGHSYGFQDMHEGNRWTVEGPFATLRKLIDFALQQGPRS